MVRRDKYSPWTVVGGTALGGRHKTTGAPNQDSWASDSVAQDGREYTVLAVADGHGGQRYVRSDVGSRNAVSVAVEVLASALTSGAMAGTPRSVEKVASEHIADELVAEWRRRCLDHLADNPFTDEERRRAGEPLEEDPLLSYGSTLLAAVVGPDRCLLMQLGDGDSLVALEDGQLLDVLPHDDRLTGGETTSLCLPDASNDFRIALVEDPSLALVLLSSDGYGVAFADPDWRQSVAQDLLAQIRERGADQVERSLPGWLADSADVGGDDATVALAHREPSSRGVGHSARQKRPVGLLGAAVSGLILGVVGGLLAAGALSGTTGASAVDATTTTAVSQATSSTAAATTTTLRSGVVTTTETADSPEVAVAYVVGFDGTVVEFTPDPTRPDPTIRDEGGDEGETWPIYAWDAVWTIASGVVLVDDRPLGLRTEPEMEVEGLEFEAGLVWMLAGDGSWLIVLDHPGQWCDVFPVAGSDGAPDPAGGGTSPMPECELEAADE